MTWDHLVLALLATETALVGWLLRDTFRTVREEMRDHRAELGRLNRAREAHRLLLSEVCLSLPAFKHREVFLDD